jgi:hypothetical protein
VVAGTIFPFTPLVGLTVNATKAQVVVVVDVIEGTGAMVATKENTASSPHKGEVGVIK